MNNLLWVLQVLAALLYGSSGVMKVFMFDKVSQDVPSFGALPRQACTKNSELHRKFLFQLVHCIAVAGLRTNPADDPGPLENWLIPPDRDTASS